MICMTSSTRQSSTRELSGVKIKGQSILAFVRALTELQGPDSVDRIRPLILPEVAQSLAQKEVLSVGWYPIEWFSSLHNAAQSVFGPGISRNISRTATRHDVTTIYRFILKFISPDTVVKQYARLFAMFCETGRVVVEENRKGFAQLKLSGLAGASQGVWEDVIGTTEVVLELCGAKSATGRLVAGGTDYSGVATVALMWTAG
ncbi:MAG: hypothetical protein U0271_45725 [Polyangiaceae bacterium]